MASGSNGNSSVLQTPKGSLLIDAGISRRRIIKGITQLDIPITDIQYILITHAHTDHVQGLPILCDYLPAKVVATPETINEIRKLGYLDDRFISVANNAIPIDFDETITLNQFKITAYPTVHDITGASAFTISFIPNDFTLSYATDTADISSRMIESMKNSDIIVLESNHNVSMLDKSRRPLFLKKRIKKTHLSNAKTMKILTRVVSKRTKAVFLAHLSGECNTPAIVCNELIKLRAKYESGWKWIVCTRWDKSSLYYYNKKSSQLSGGLSSLTYENLYQNNDLALFFDT